MKRPARIARGIVIGLTAVVTSVILSACGTTTANPVAACSLAPTAQIQKMASAAHPRLRPTETSSTDNAVYYDYDMYSDSHAHTETTKVCTYSTDRLTDTRYAAATIALTNLAHGARDERFGLDINAYAKSPFRPREYVPSPDASLALSNMHNIVWLVPAAQVKSKSFSPRGVIFESNVNDAIVTIFFDAPVRLPGMIHLVQTVDANVQKQLGSTSSPSRSASPSGVSPTGSASQSTHS